MTTRTYLVERTVILCVFLLPITMGTVPGAASTINITLLLIALFFAWQHWKDLTREEKILCWGMIAFFLAAWLSFINSEDVAKSWARLERLLRVLSFVPIFIFFRRLGRDLTKPLTLGLLIAGPALLVAANLETDGGRATGAYNAILFGDFAALVSSLLLVHIVFKHTSWALKMSSLISLLCALQATGLSGTRGAWLGFAVSALVVSGVFLAKQGSIKSARVKAVIFIATAAATSTAFFANQNISNRVYSGYEEFQLYLSGTNVNTSVGLRFQMWEAGVKIWLKNPIVGSGLGDYLNDVQRMIESGESKLPIAFGEGHSLYFELLGTTGTLGLFTCIFSLFLYPMLMIAKRLRTETEVFSLLGGLVVVLCFASFGVSQNWLSRSSITSVYLILLAIFIQRRPSNESKPEALPNT